MLTSAPARFPVTGPDVLSKGAAAERRNRRRAQLPKGATAERRNCLTAQLTNGGTTAQRAVLTFYSGSGRTMKGCESPNWITVVPVMRPMDAE